MKVTVGGSFHEPGWTAVCNLIKRLKQSGHEVLAPGDEWVPVNKDDSFVRFKGEEKKSVSELQNGFFDKMDESDAYIVCNPNSYEGFAVSMEVGYAAASILKGTGNLKHMYLMEQPLGYGVFKENPQISLEDFESRVRTDPRCANELNYFNKFSTIKEGFGYTSFSDFYSDVKDFLVKVMVLEKKGALTIGLDSLLEVPKKEKEETDDIEK